MAYSTNPHLPKARATALKMLLIEQLPLQTVAHKCGVHRSTIWRWKHKWGKLNQDWQMDNPNRPSRAYSRLNHLSRCSWRIPTVSSKPHTSPNAVSDELVALVLAVRAQLKRCAEVVWHHVVTVLGVPISLSSVRRILWRAGLARGRKNRLHRSNPRRPLPTKPGELVQTDTIHHVDPTTGRRLYYYTVIDVYTRMAHSVLLPRLGAGLAARVVLEAQAALGFRFAMVQSDNGPEYSRFYEDVLRRNGIQVRHSRLHRPNDNAHIERFNRTLQTECIGHYWSTKQNTKTQQARLNAYLAHYNHQRVHLGLQMRTPGEMLQRC